jgi:transposase
MIQIPSNANVLIMHAPINFRNGIDGTAAIARVVLEREPMDGALFVFRSKTGHSLRILYYDGSGFWICTKRLSKGTFNVAWPKGDGTKPCSTLLVRELQILIWGADPASCRFPDAWRKVA